MHFNAVLTHLKGYIAREPFSEDALPVINSNSHSGNQPAKITKIHEWEDYMEIYNLQ